MVSPRLWESPRFKDLASDQERFLLLYFLTGPHQTAAGVYRLPDAYAASDLAWDVNAYRRARAALVAAGVIKADETTNEILIERWFSHCPPTNGQHLRGVEKQIETIASAKLRAAAFEALKGTPQWKLRDAKSSLDGANKPYDLTERLARKT